MEYSYSHHAKVMLQERSISEKLVVAFIENPDTIEDRPDGTRHYSKRFVDIDGRWLRVILNIEVEPVCIITVFFDRRLRRREL